MKKTILELIPAGRWGHPYEMGALTAFLCSPGAGYINGVDILADGGQNAGVLSRRFDRHIKRAALQSECRPF